MEADPALQRSPASLSSIYVPSAAGGQVPLSSIATFEERPEPLLINHLEPVSRRTRSPSTCRAAARSETRSRRSAGSRRRSGCPTASSRASRAPRRRVRELAVERAVPDRGGDPDHVHHPRDPLRELHPSDHDPLDAAVGRDRGPPGPHGGRQRPRGHRDHRDHPPDRHREEERDHDDRLRARRREERRASRRARRSTRRASCVSGPS
jgi:hypothetical protein